MIRQSQLNKNFTKCEDCENYSKYPCEGCNNHQMFAIAEHNEEENEYYLHDGHTRKIWKRSKNGWSFMPLYTKDYTIEKQLTDMEYKRQNWTL